MLEEVIIDGGSIHPVAYEEVEHVQINRSFLVDPQRYLNHLFADPD